MVCETITIFLVETTKKKSLINGWQQEKVTTSEYHCGNSEVEILLIWPEQFFCSPMCETT
jgi:hypothetical protein